MKQVFEKYWFRPYTPIIFLLLVVAAGYFWAYPAVKRAISPSPITQIPPISPARNASQRDAGGPTPQTLGSTTDVLSQVSKLMNLPTDEQPRIVTVTDSQKFKDQPFLRNAKNGDVLLVYEKNKKVILFDPKANKIIDVAPIALPSPKPTPTVSAAQTPLASPSARPNL